MKLLIRRDSTILVPTAGQSSFYEDLPVKLRVPHVVLKHLIDHITPRLEDEKMLLSREDILERYTGVSDLQKPYNDPNNSEKIMSVFWNGTRSVIVRDKKSDKLYKIKGVAINPRKPLALKIKDDTIIAGGQKRENGLYEKIMTEKFNKILDDNGIENIIEYKGMWRYPVRAAKYRPVATIFEVKGDTRLDEFMCMVEGIFFDKLKEQGIAHNNRYRGHLFNENGKKVVNILAQIYTKIGLNIGEQKKVMDQNLMTWSSGGDRTNAHHGNVVLYFNNGLKIGLVDFDASCDTNDYSKSEIIAIQKKEYNQFLKSIYTGNISARGIDGMKPAGQIVELRDSLKKGFLLGYGTEPVEKNLAIDEGLVQEVFYMLNNKTLFIENYMLELEKLYAESTYSSKARKNLIRYEHDLKHFQRLGLDMKPILIRT